jgi:hypothetical protein
MLINELKNNFSETHSCRSPLTLCKKEVKEINGEKFKEQEQAYYLSDL